MAVHIRARESGEDKDDWPTAESPDEDLLQSLARCIEQAAQLEFGDQSVDVYLAATTEKALRNVEKRCIFMHIYAYLCHFQPFFISEAKSRLAGWPTSS